MTDKRISRTYKLTPATIDRLDMLMKSEELSRTAVIERLVRAEAERVADSRIKSRRR